LYVAVSMQLSTAPSPSQSVFFSSASGPTPKI